MKWLKHLPFLLLSACASVDWADYRQPVLALSDPPGARVYRGEEYLGTTPAYIPVRRGKSPELRFEYEGKSRNVSLETEYRWGDSFGMNFLLLIYAPGGWIVDYLTGNAWELRDPPLQRFVRGGEWPRPRRPRLIAVAPPQAEDIEVTEGLGFLLTNKLADTAKVMDFDKTAPVFQFYGGEKEFPQDKLDRYRMLQELGADHILHSRAERRGASFRVEAELKDAVTSRTFESYSWEVTPREASLRREITRKDSLWGLFHLLPNTVFLNLASYTPSVTIDQQDYDGKEAATNSSLDELLKYVSALGVATLKKPLPNVRGQWTFDFVPAAVASRKTIVFPDYTPANDVEFQRWHISAGYGVEGGYLWKYGFVYLDLIPMYTWTQVSYENDFVKGTISRDSVTMMAELGYTYFFTDHLVARLFVRSLDEDDHVWSSAISHVAGRRTFPYMNTSIAGLSIGYYIPSSLKSRSGWQVRDTRATRQ